MYYLKKKTIKLIVPNTIHINTNVVQSLYLLIYVQSPNLAWLYLNLPQILHHKFFVIQ